MRDRGRAAGRDLAQTVKTIALTVEPRTTARSSYWVLLLRGDHELNEIKVGKVAGLAGHRFSTEAEILEVFGTVPGYLGPVGTKLPVTVVADRTVANMADFVCGANEEDFHYTGVNWGRDLPEPIVADLRNVVEGDASPDGKGVLAIERGIEVGHVFQLGTAYSEAMERHLPRRERQAGAAADGLLRHRRDPHPGRGDRAELRRQGHRLAGRAGAVRSGAVPDGHGPQRDGQGRRPSSCTPTLQAAGVDVIVDDRGLRPGAMFADWELIGVPHRVVIGERGLKEGNLEYQGRRDAEASGVPVGDMVAFIKGKLGK